MEATERAWVGGPLRRVGTGNGVPSRYICERCLQLAKTGVRLSAFEPGVGQFWLCASCEAGTVRKTRPTMQGRPFLRKVAG